MACSHQLGQSLTPRVLAADCMVSTGRSCITLTDRVAARRYCTQQPTARKHQQTRGLARQRARARTQPASSARLRSYSHSFIRWKELQRRRCVPQMRRRSAMAEQFGVPNRGGEGRESGWAQRTGAVRESAAHLDTQPTLRANLLAVFHPVQPAGDHLAGADLRSATHVGRCKRGRWADSAGAGRSTSPPP